MQAPEGFVLLGILMLSLIALAPVVDAGCACSAVGNWEAKAQEFLKSDDTGGQPVSSSSAQASTAATQPKTLARSESFPNGEILKPVKNVSSSELVIDVSNDDSYAKSHIKNAIHIPTKDFLDGEGNLKTNEELAKILGNAGVSRDDSIVLYGNSESSGEAEFAFLVLRYLGQKDVKLLDGSLADWQAAGLPVEASENNRPGVEYKPEIKPNVMADYEYVKSGQAQIMDARPFVEFGKGRIPGSTALDSANIIKGDIGSETAGILVCFQQAEQRPADRGLFQRLQPVISGLVCSSAHGIQGQRLYLGGLEGARSCRTAPTARLGRGDTANSKYTKLGST